MSHPIDSLSRLLAQCFPQLVPQSPDGFLRRLRALIANPRFDLPVALPGILAGALVSVLAIQSVHSVRANRRAVQTTLQDYAAFTTWQYARRASDYLRLTVVLGLSGAAAGGAAIDCGDARAVAPLTAATRRAPADVIDRAVHAAMVQAQRSHGRLGLVALGDPRTHQFLSYQLEPGPHGAYSRCAARILEDDELHSVMMHVASFAPLLPGSLPGPMHPDSLVAVRLEAADGSPIASWGGATTGLSSSDTLGPDLGGLRVVTTLHPMAISRLVPGGVPSSNAPGLLSLLGVALVLCGVSIAQLRRAEKLARLRNDFVASVSHELKTPLAQISLFADTLAAPRERSLYERQQYLAIIGREARRLGHLVDSILHFATMTRQRTGRVAFEPTVLGDELREAVTAFGPIAAARGVRVLIHVNAEAELPLDRNGFRQVMLNVLDNALKFGPDGGAIIVTAGIDGTHASITVDDEGHGIPLKERERVFQPFERADRHERRAGSGIGLAIVRGVMHDHGGAARIADSPFGGARIELLLPGATRLGVSCAAPAAAL